MDIQDKNNRFLDYLSSASSEEIAERFSKEQVDMRAKTVEIFNQYDTWCRGRPSLFGKVVAAAAASNCLSSIFEVRTVNLLSPEDRELLAFEALKKGDVSVVRALLATGFNINAPLPGNLKALYVATDSGSFEMVNLLLEHPNLNVFDQSVMDGRMNFISLAVSRGQDGFVERFLEHGVSPLLVSAAALQQAWEGGNIEMLHLLRNRVGVDELYLIELQAADLTRIGALDAALFWRSGRMVPTSDELAELAERCLEERDAIPMEEFVRRGLVPSAHHNLLRLATQLNNIPALEALIKAGADVDDIIGLRGRSCLMMAAEAGHLGVVECLLKAGACVNQRARGESALSLAFENRRTDVAMLLLEHGAKMPSRDSGGRTIAERMNAWYPLCGYAAEAFEEYMRTKNPIAKLCLLSLEDLSPQGMAVIEKWLVEGDPDGYLIATLSHPVLAMQLVREGRLLERILAHVEIHKIGTAGLIELSSALHLSPDYIVDCVKRIPLDERQRRQALPSFPSGVNVAGALESFRALLRGRNIRQREPAEVERFFSRQLLLPCALMAAEAKGEELFVEMLTTLPERIIKVAVPHLSHHALLSALSLVPQDLQLSFLRNATADQRHKASVIDAALVEALDRIEKSLQDICNSPMESAEDTDKCKQAFCRVRDDIRSKDLRSWLSHEGIRFETLRQIEGQCAVPDDRIAPLSKRIQAIETLMNDTLSKKLGFDKEVAVPPEYCCPITLVPMKEPVTDSYGHNYDRKAIVRWIRTHHNSPLTKQPLELIDLRPNEKLREEITRFLKENAGRLSVEDSAPSQPDDEDADDNDIDSPADLNMPILDLLRLLDFRL